MEKIQNQCEMRKTMNELNARWDELIEEFDGKIGIHNEAVNSVKKSKTSESENDADEKKAELNAADEDFRKAFDHFVTEADHLCEKYEEAVRQYGEPAEEKDSTVKIDFLTMIGLNLHIYSEMVEDALRGFEV